MENGKNNVTKIWFKDAENVVVVDNAELRSFFDKLYNLCNSIFNCNSSNQTISGQALYAEDFRYDYKNDAPNCPIIEANESRLTNKLFDPCRMTGTDKSLTFQEQYRTALDMLTPKLNAKVAEAKNQLRELLMTEYPYDFGDGDNKRYTLQEVFFRLYDEYIAEAERWAETQNAQKEELRKKYPGTDAESNSKYNAAYLEWYETVAENALNAINEKMSKVISVFTPNDMKILEGIFDSGSGAELQQARQTLENTQKITPDGGYVYPVTINPANWFELPDTSFTPMDLLKTTDALAMQLQTLSSKRLYLSARIEDISALIPERSSVEAAQGEVSSAKQALDDAQSNLINTYGKGIKPLLSTVFDIAPLFMEGIVPANIISRLATGMTFPDGKDLSDLIKDINDIASESSTAQQQLINASQKLADASVEAIEAQNLSNLIYVISPLKEQLNELNKQIQEIQIQLSPALYT